MKIAIIDDMKSDSMILAKYLRRYFRENYSLETVVIEWFEDGEQFVRLFEEGTYELILIDYFMKEMNGLETAQYIRRSDSLVPIIFVTVSRDFAIDCYKVRAVDYIVKPIVYIQIEEAMSLINLSRLRDGQYICILCGREQVKVFLKDIVYCDASGHYVQVHVRGCKILRTRIPFAQFIQKLAPYSQFLLCYKGCLINMDQMTGIEKSDFVTSEGEHIPIRQKEYKSLAKTYYDYIFTKVKSGR